MKCIYCHTEIAADSRFCTNCGKDLSGLVRCENCGELLGDEDEYCPHCGSKQPENNIDQSLKDGETASVSRRSIASPSASSMLISVNISSLTAVR